MWVPEGADLGERPDFVVQLFGGAAFLLPEVGVSPSGLDLFAVGPDEDALGWPVSTEAELVAMVERLPFEPSMLMLSWLEAAV